MTTNKEVQKELLRLTSLMNVLAKDLPSLLWETKTPFLRALDKCIEALRHPLSGDHEAGVRLEVDILAAYVEFCRAQAATVARIPPTSGDDGPEDPTPVCR